MNRCSKLYQTMYENFINDALDLQQKRTKDAQIGDKKSTKHAQNLNKSFKKIK